MEVVIQISNIYEDGCHKISREMYSSLYTAVTILDKPELWTKRSIPSMRRGVPI